MSSRNAYGIWTVIVAVAAIWFVAHNWSSWTTSTKSPLLREFDADDRYDSAWTAALNQYVDHWNLATEAHTSQEKVSQLGECLTALNGVGAFDTTDVNSDFVHAIQKWASVAREEVNYRIQNTEAWIPSWGDSPLYKKRTEDAQFAVFAARAAISLRKAQAR